MPFPANALHLLLSLNPFAIAGLVTAISSLVFGCFVYIQNTRSNLNRKWMIFTLFIALWGYGAFCIAEIQAPLISLLAWKLSFGTAVIWIPPLLINFIL